MLNPSCAQKRNWISVKSNMRGTLIEKKAQERKKLDFDEKIWIRKWRGMLGIESEADRMSLGVHGYTGWHQAPRRRQGVKNRDRAAQKDGRGAHTQHQL